MANIIERVFLYKVGNQDIKLPDIGYECSVDEVKDFYANSYSELTNAKIIGPNYVNDQLTFRFELTMGTKG